MHKSLLLFLILLLGGKGMAQKDQKKVDTYSIFTQVESNQYRSSTTDILLDYLDLSEKSSMKLLSTSKDQLGYSHHQYQHYYNGVPVEGSVITLHEKRDLKTLISGYHINLQEVEITPKISVDQAKLSVVNHFNNQDKQTTITIDREQKLVIYQPVKGTADARLAYKFDYYSHDPLYKADVYVDAVNGKVIDDIPTIHYAEPNASGMSLYDGQVDIHSDFDGNQFNLMMMIDNQSVLETYSLENQTDYNNAVAISSTDNYFNEDNAAVQAHWGASSTYDYYLHQHKRNSYDGNGSSIKSYVHYSSNYNNAFWDGSRMTYGDGDGTTYLPLVSLDIVAHEITHGVIQHSAGLIYRYEPGALNESFADIFAESVEFHTKGSNDWLIGDEIFVQNGQAIRSMSDPGEFGDPDTYLGNNYYEGSNDNGGVHINSGVQNKWFYILSDGENGINDHGENYEVSGIGIANAAKIAYRNLTTYLHNRSTFFDARQGSIQAAKDLFGENSQEVIATTNAWYAVGVGSSYGNEGCKAGAFALELTFDNYPEETSWKILNVAGEIVAQEGPYDNMVDGSTHIFNQSFEAGDYTFIISDAYGDGICCGYGSGRYTISIGDVAIKTGSYFGETDSTKFCLIDTQNPEDPDITPPSPPSELITTNITHHSAVASWSVANDDNGIKGYNVYLNGVLLDFTESLYFDLLQLDPETTYILSVEAVDLSDNLSLWENHTFSTLLAPDITSPTTPDNLSVSDITSNSARISWSPSTDDSDIRGYHINLNTLSYEFVTSSTVLIEGLSEQTVYNVEVIAEDIAGNNSGPGSISFETLKAPDITPPTPPDNILVSNITNNSADVEWDIAFDENGVDIYNIYLNDEWVSTSVSNTISLTNLIPETVYIVGIEAQDPSGNISERSESLFITESDPDNIAPTAPTTVEVYEISHLSAQISWTPADDNTGVIGYHLFLGGQEILFTDNLSALLTGLSPETYYEVGITAEDFSGNISSMVTTSFTTLEAPDITAPNAPTGLDIQNITYESALLTWNSASDPSGISHYEVFINNAFLAQVSETSLTLHNLSPATNYNIKIRATDNAGNTSDFSNAIAFTTNEEPDLTPPSPPTDLDVINLTSNTATVTWTASNDNIAVASYDIYLDGEWVANTSQLYIELTGLSQGQEYVITIIAFDGANNSSVPSEIIFSTLIDPSGPTTILASYFESGWDGWSDNGRDCFRYRGSYSYEGEYSIRLRDNSGLHSSMSSQPLDLSNYQSVDLSFYFLPSSMEPGENFSVSYFDGTEWHEIANYIRGIDFENDNYYYANISLYSSVYRFGNNASFKIQCDASSNADKIYIDQVIIQGQSSTSIASNHNENALRYIKDGPIYNTNIEEKEEEITISPNPIQHSFDLLHADDINSVSIWSIDGKWVKDLDPYVLSGIDISYLNQGIYILVVNTSEEINHIKFIKK